MGLEDHKGENEKFTRSEVVDEAPGSVITAVDNLVQNNLTQDRPSTVIKRKPEVETKCSPALTSKPIISSSDKPVQETKEGSKEESIEATSPAAGPSNQQNGIVQESLNPPKQFLMRLL